MAANADGRPNIEEQQLTEGHVIYYTVCVPNIASLTTRFFRHDFKTACEVLSTSWEFDLVYHEVTDMNELSFSVAFVRKDTIEKKVGAHILMQICNNNDCPIYCPNEFQKDEMLPGDAIRENVFKIPPLILFDILQVEEIVLNIVLKIKSCHSFFD